MKIPVCFDVLNVHESVLVCPRSESPFGSIVISTIRQRPSGVVSRYRGQILVVCITANEIFTIAFLFDPPAFPGIGVVSRIDPTAISAQKQVSIFEFDEKDCLRRRVF